MAEENERPAAPVAARYGVIVILDALGIKKVLARDEPGSVLAAWRNTISQFEEAAAAARTRPECQNCRVYAFSDTIIITVQGHLSSDEPTDDEALAVYEALIELVGDLIRYPFAMALFSRVYLRGVITVGRFYESDRSSDAASELQEVQAAMVIGPAIDEAAEWYEQSNWIGIICSPTTGYALQRMAYRGDLPERLFVKHPVPMRADPKDKEERWVLAWPAVADVWAKENGEDAKQIILAAFTMRPIGVAEAPKYKHTLDFLEAVLGT